MHDLQPDNTVVAPLHDTPPVWQVALISLLLVVAFAAPSFQIASSEAVHPAGLWIPMVGMFLFLYVLACLPDLRRKVGTRVMMRAAIYVLVGRIILLCLIVGIGIDFILGMVAVGIANSICSSNPLDLIPQDFPTPKSTDPAFLATFLATCIQGAFLFAEFLIILAIAYPVAKRQIELKNEISSACLNCGYDLRMTPARCPECGTKPTEEQMRFMLEQARETATA